MSSECSAHILIPLAALLNAARGRSLRLAGAVVIFAGLVSMALGR
jgi:hypothetical protein